VLGLRRQQERSVPGLNGMNAVLHPSTALFRPDRNPTGC
jgi:hypothetical protein